MNVQGLKPYSFMDSRDMVKKILNTEVFR
jgi:hypothetical protein